MRVSRPAWHDEDWGRAAEPQDGAAAPQLAIDALCPPGSSDRRELVACLARMYEELRAGAPLDAEACDGYAAGAS